MTGVSDKLLDRAALPPSQFQRQNPRVLIGPVLLPIAAAVAFVHHYGVPLGQITIYVGYLFFVIVLPGAILWHLLYRGEGDAHVRGARMPALEYLVCGAALGYAVELVSYASARAVGHPRLYLLAPITVVASAALWDLAQQKASWRRWRRSQHSDRSRARSWSVWAITAIVTYVIVWYSVRIFRTHPLNATRITDPDEMFHLALVGDLRHHFPATYPYVEYPGDLTYQWFVHAHMAASSWATGILPETLYRRFDPITLTVLAILGVAMLAVRVSGRLAAGPIAAVVLVLVGSFDVTGTAIGEASPEERFLQGLMLMHSPTQAFAYVLSIPVILLALDLVSSKHSQGRRWLLLLVTTLTVTGAKVAFLPLYVCGYVAAALSGVVGKRGQARRAWLAAGLTVVVIAASSWVLYRGDSQSLRMAPLQSADFYMARLGVAGGGTGGRLVFAASLLAMWTISGVGAVGLFLDKTTRWDPRTWFLVGSIAAGYGATFLLGHGGNSQLFFGRAAAPLVAIACAWGVVVLFDDASRRQILSAVGVATAAGLLLLAVRAVTEGLTQMSPLHGKLVETPLLRVWVNLPTLLAVVAMLLLARILLSDLTRGRCTLHLRVMVAFLVGLGLARTFAFVIGHVEPDPQAHKVTMYGTDGRQAALWLKAHSAPADRVLTNAHCGPVRPRKGKTCDARHFWMSALSERRFVIEGWAYTARSSSDWTAGFWGDRELLERNDKLFVAPDRERFHRFLADHPAKWMFVDVRYPADLEALMALPEVRLRFEAGDYRVLEVDSAQDGRRGR